MLKVIGLQRTGTNWVERLLDENFTQTVHFHGENPCWKHSMPGPDAMRSLEECRVVLVAKKPRAWFYSLYRENAAWKAQLARKRPTLFKDGEIDPLPAARFYERFYDEWLFGLESLWGAFVRYETLLSSLEAGLFHVGMQLGLSPVAGGVRTVHAVPQSRRWSKQLTDFYLRDDFPLTPKQRDAADSIDPLLLKQMGYK